MEHLVGQTPTLVIAVVLLVIVGSLPALPAEVGARGRAVLITPLLSCVVCAAGLWQALEHGRVLPDTFGSKVVKYAASELGRAREPLVLVFDGGSYVLNGVDVGFVLEELHAAGVRAEAVRIAAGAANHFDRYRMQQQVVERLGQKQPGQRWIYLTEVSEGYDTNPLTQFTDNLDTDRTYHYVTLSNALAMAGAVSSRGVRVPEAWRWDLTRHAAVNAFNAGALSRLVPEAGLESGGGRVNDRTRANFRFRGLAEEIAVTHKRVRGEILPWLSRIREPRSKQLWQDYASELVYFGVPSTSVDHLTYARSFCRASKQPCIAPDDPVLLAALDGARFWRDQSHMTRKGAAIYSHWLAQQLLKRGIVHP